MKLSFSDKKQFISYALKQHLGLIGIWLVFILVGSFFAYLGLNVNEGLGFIIFGILFIILSSAFMLFTLPSSTMHYYEQALTKKHGSYTTAKITNKRIDDYSHTTETLNSSKRERVTLLVYVIEFQFNYNNTIYNSEVFIEHKSTFDAITKDIELPIKFLKTNPKNITLRRKKLASEIGIPEKMCQ